jgi:very-short-patch-repair endonuclease
VIAGRQLQLVTLGQLRAVGLSNDAVTTRCRRGSLRRVYAGVYLFGGLPMLPGARELAAVLTCGGCAVVSHVSAAVIWGLVPSAAVVHVTVVARKCRSRPGLQVHRASELANADRSTRHGIPVTAPARTLIDLAGTAEDHELDRAIGEARVQGLVNDRDLRAALQRAGRRAGVGRLRATLNSEDESDYTPQAAEGRMRQLVKQARLPRPVYQAIVEGWPVDFLWPEQRLIVEVDGYKFHSHRGAFERDRRKDIQLVAAGYRVVRVTWRQLVQEPIAVAAMLAAALAV